MRQRLVAWTNLAYRFAIHVLWRVPARTFGQPAGYARLQETLAAEGFQPVSASERTEFPRFMQCIHCGLCTLACPALRDTPQDAWQEAWTFVSGPSRTLERAQLMPTPAPCTRCGECEAACPTGVPISLMAAMIERLAAEPRIHA